MRQGAELFPARQDFEYLASGGSSGTPPKWTSTAMPYAGWYVLRSGWTPKDRYLLFEAGPFGKGHQHEDKLNLIVHDRGRTIVTEAGNYAYDSSAWRSYALSTRAHNTVIVDGREQNRRRKPETYVVWQPQANRFFFEDWLDYAEGTYNDGYGPQGEVDVAHPAGCVCEAGLLDRD